MERTNFLRCLLKYNGYLEKASNKQLESLTANPGHNNYTLFGKWYDEYFKTQGFNGAPWCHAYITYCAHQAGLTDKQIPYTASCATGVSWFKKHNCWHDAKGYKPVPGDLIYFHDGNGKPIHVGVVIDTDTSRVLTIEGNTSGDKTLEANGGAVVQKAYRLAYARILGYGTPKFKKDVNDDLAQLVEKLAAKLNVSVAEVEIGLERVLETVLHTPQSWEVAGEAFLRAKGLCSSVHDANEIVTFGKLGAIEQKRK